MKRINSKTDKILENPFKEADANGISFNMPIPPKPATPVPSPLLTPDPLHISSGRPGIYRFRKETVPLWNGIEDILSECKLIEKYLPFMRQSEILEMDELQFAMMYVESFVDHGEPNELFAIYELLKAHALLMRNKELGKRPIG